MKKDMVIGLACGLVAGFLVGALIFSLGGKSKGQTPRGMPVVAFAMEEIKELNDTTLARVESIAVPLSDFSNAYANIQKTLPPEQLAYYKQQEGAFKAEVLETIINQYAVVSKALKDGFLNDPENMKAMQGALNAALQQLYVTKNAPTNANAFAPSTPEIDQAFAQYGAQMRARGMNAQQIREYITTQLAQQKQQLWMANFLRKIREGYRVERNDALIKAQGISIDPLGAPPAPPAPPAK